MPVGELFLAAFLQVLFDRLASRELLRFLRREGLYSKIIEWKKAFEMIQAMLGDAEEKQLTNSAVNMWLDDLRDLAYDVEDILDEFATEVLARELKMEQHDDQLQACTCRVKVLKFATASFRKLSPWAIGFDNRMGAEIEDVTSRLERLCKLRYDLGLQLNFLETWSTPTSSHDPVYHFPQRIVKRHDDEAKILEMVLDADANFRVIPIVGMGGVGKTTLVRQVYNNEAVVQSFEVKVWVCVSDNFDLIRILKSILERITRSPCALNDLSTVQHEVKQKITGKKFLLVLDDVWTNDFDRFYSRWENLKSIVMVAAPESRIIVTTRIAEAALKIRPDGFYRLNLLPYEDCWPVFLSHAFESIPSRLHHREKRVRQKVIEKCKGLPLAAKSLGALLRSKPIDEWLEILNTKMWDLVDGGKIPATLKLSYYYLPSHLKRCFAYCAIFPKDYEFQMEELVFLWKTEGLLQSSTQSIRWEDKGEKFFNDLLSMSLFQESNTNVSRFTMHDLVNDLAHWASGETCFRFEDILEANEQLESFKKVRHLSYACGHYTSKSKFEVLKEVERANPCLRTFLPLSISAVSGKRYITHSIISDLLPKFKKLRALSLEDYYVIELPESIGNLRHLRFLNLSGTMIKSLPESTSSLLNLEILKLRDCSRLRKLPSKTRDLISLCYLDIRGVCLDELPLGLNELKCKLYLSNFIVDKGVRAGLNGLKNLNFCGELCISGLENIVHIYEPKEMILNNKSYLEALQLEWDSQFDDTPDKVKQQEVLDMLRPHQCLEKLTIICYGGTKFPPWVGNPSFFKLRVIRLERCENCVSFPSLGLLKSLNDLTIKGMKGLKTFGFEIYGEGCSNPFRSLKTLCFKDLPEWKHWEPVNGNDCVFRLLRELSIVKCPKLSGTLPDHFPSLEKLVIKKCEQLVVSLPSISLLCELQIDGCKGMTCNSLMDFESLKSMTISNMGCDQLMNSWQLNGTFLSLLGKPPQGLQCFTSLEVICIENCSNFDSFLEFCFISHLNKLEIRNCNALTSLPEGMNHKNGGLEILNIEDCNSVTFIVRGQLPSSLKSLNVRNCAKLECLWDDKGESNINNTSTSLLECLQVSDCPSLMCLSSSSQLPETLKDLQIISCSQLTTLSQSGRLPATVKNLSICYCSQLTMLSSGPLPESLCHLKIEHVPKLESIAERFPQNASLEDICLWDCENLKSVPKGLHNLSHLQKIDVYKCPSIVCFPEGGLPSTSLREVVISKCEKLQALPDRFHSLNALQKLRIVECPSMTSFPENGFPTNITSLEIEDCVNMYKALVEWGLHNLTCLTSLDIKGCPDAESFPQQLLPDSLTRLNIERFPRLKSLCNHVFQSLTSLESLWISDCSNLISFPEQGLPSSLLELRILRCPLLKDRCKRDKGIEWSKISDIPCVLIDSKFIYDQEVEA